MRENKDTTTKGADMKDDPKYCPDCGQETAYVIERIDNGDEVKIACGCEVCHNLWYMIRSTADEA